jgi:hypothetical protein
MAEDLPYRLAREMGDAVASREGVCAWCGVKVEGEEEKGDL